MPYSYPPKYALKEDTRLISETIDALETHVGDYSNPKGTDIATDLSKVWDDVYPKPERDGTSISERMGALDDTETGAVPALIARADAVDQQLFETQGMADKLAAIELRKDETVEILQNKNIVNPQINETPVRAYFDIALAAPATKRIRISAITPGTAANSYTYDVIATVDPEDMDILWASPTMSIRVLKDGDDKITTTAYELARLAATIPDFVSNFIISFDDGTLITKDGNGTGVIAAADSGSFANGAGADHVLTSTGTQIDAVVAQYHLNKYDGTGAPRATDDSTKGYSVGSRWYDATHTEWYICTSAVENTATWELTTLDTGDLGSAAVADIVNDLTTGGTTDALSAEMGKNLAEVIGTYEGEETIATDLAKVYGDVETAETGLLARAAALEAVAPTTGAPKTTQVAAKATYDTDKITFTADAVGADGNNITVEASCRLSATLGSGTTEITLVGALGLHSGSTPPLVSVQITQAATEASLSITNTAGVIVIELPAGGGGYPVAVPMANLVLAIEAEMGSSGELDGVVVDVETGDSYDPAAIATVTGAVAFTAAANTVTEDGDVVTIYLANDGTNFDDWDDVVTEVNLDDNSTLVTASAGAQSEAEPFEAISLTGGVDITAGAPGAIRYEADKIWISVAESTASESNWAYASLTAPNA